jgi:hypothetical protein
MLLGWQLPSPLLAAAPAEPAAACSPALTRQLLLQAAAQAGSASSPVGTATLTGSILQALQTIHTIVTSAVLSAMQHSSVTHTTRHTRNLHGTAGCTRVGEASHILSTQCNCHYAGQQRLIQSTTSRNPQQTEEMALATAIVAMLSSIGCLSQVTSPTAHQQVESLVHTCISCAKGCGMSSGTSGRRPVFTAMTATHRSTQTAVRVGTSLV